MNTIKYDNLNPQVAFVDDTTLRQGIFYKIKALDAVTFSLFSKNKCLADGVEDSTLDMSTVKMAAGDTIIVNFGVVQLASGSALLYIAGMEKQRIYDTP